MAAPERYGAQELNPAWGRVLKKSGLKEEIANRWHDDESGERSFCREIPEKNPASGEVASVGGVRAGAGGIFRES
jgi:hypothetical protein